MITPPFAEPPRIGVLPAPAEDELIAACDDLRDEALAPPWAAEYLGLETAQVEALVRAGELLAIPGPWPMRQAYLGGRGSFLPSWQFEGRRPHPVLPEILRSAVAAGWSSLDLHRFMTARPAGSGDTPARLLHSGEAELVLALIRGESVPPAPLPQSHLPRRRPRHLQRPHRPRVRRVAT